jgi:hypothetical protein
LPIQEQQIEGEEDELIRSIFVEQRSFFVLPPGSKIPAPPRR